VLLVTQVVAGNQADDPFYVPAIDRVLQIIYGVELLFVGDCKMSALPTRAHIHRLGHHYLCTLAQSGKTGEEMSETHPSVGDVRSIGLFGVLELVRDRRTRQPMAPFNGTSPEMETLCKTLLDHGLFISTHWHTILIVPPLIIT